MGCQWNQRASLGSLRKPLASSILPIFPGRGAHIFATLARQLLWNIGGVREGTACRKSADSVQVGQVAHCDRQLAGGFSNLASRMHFLARGSGGVGSQCAARLHVARC